MNLNMRASIRWARRGAILFALCCNVLPARAAFDCEAEYTNPWYNTNGLGGSLTNSIAHATVAYNGHAGPYSLPGGLAASVPSDGDFQMVRASLGLPFPEIVPDAAIGDVLAPPNGAATNHTPLVIFPGNGAFVDPATGRVIAASHGSVTMQWLMADGTTNTMVYEVSAVATQRPEKLFWTEAPYYSPVVSLSGKFARIHYNDDVRAPVVTTNIVTTSGTNSVTNVVTDFSATVWIDDSNGSKSLRAQGCSGLFVLELFETGDFASQIGCEVVQVLAPQIQHQQVSIGQRLLPQDTFYGTASLQARISSGVNPAGEDNFYLHASSNGKSPMEGWLYAIYRTVDDPWDAEVYWMHPGVAGILWPFEKDQYVADWPVDCQVMACAPGLTNAAPALIPTVLNPVLMTMEDPIRNFALNNGVLTVQTNGYGLLKYTSQDEGVWFQVVRAVAHDSPLLYNLTPVPWDVGQEIRPALARSALALNPYTYVDCGTGPTVTDQNPRTIEFWANFHPTFMGNQTSYMFRSGEFQPSTDTGKELSLIASCASAEGKPDFLTLIAHSTQNPYFVCSFPLPEGCVGYWHHYAVTYDSVYLSFFIDGTNMVTPGFTDPINGGVSPAMPCQVALDTAPGPFQVGGHGSLPRDSRDVCDIMNVRVWSEARTSEQLLRCMNRDLGVQELKDANLLASYPFNASEGAVAYDFARGYAATINFPGGYVASTAPVSTDLSPWSEYPGFIHSGRSYNPDLYAYPLLTNNPNSGSAIFAVHTNSPLEVWWANRYQPAGLPAAIYWPSLVTRYQPQWPTNVPTLVLAHQTEAANALPDNAVNAIVYYQNDVTQVGFNPNEEHALILGNAVYAIRNDLNTTNLADSSAPLVLVEYTDGNSGQAAMAAYKVVATNSQYGFNYPVTVPSLLEPMAPLSFLANPNCTNTAPSSGPAWPDRNQQWWAYRAGTNGVSPETVRMNWCYQNQPGFYYPGEVPQPAVGQEIPFLSGHGSRGQPRPVTYTVNWPASAPVLRVGDTLVKPDQQQVGLPDISDQLSVDILFQQSLPHAFATNTYTIASGVQVTLVSEYAVKNGSPSVVLIDPTAYRSSTAKFALPSDVKRQVVNGRTYFPDLPPQLNQRLWWEQTQLSPIAGQLRILGQYVEPAAGVPYLLLNLLAADERAAALSLSADANWQGAVNGLPANVVEITSGNQPFDSLALSAGIGRGKGFVTLAFNDSTNLPPGTPISLTCFQVEPPLVTGEVKAIAPADVLNEQMTMRHTTDCAGHPENYRFDWRYNTSDSNANYSTWPSYGGPAVGANQITFGSGQPMFTLSDNYFVCRYQSLDPLNPAGTNWSAWTEPMIAESWVKRSMNAINPYNQRVTNYQQQPPDYTINMLALAGGPYLGDVALNSEHINEFGLIEIYWTIFNRALNMAAALPGGGDQAINDTLRYAATRLNALYMLLGNEAYADALDPTIGFSAQSDWDSYGDILTRASSLFCFMNQVPTLLDEELCLLRGRDDKLKPGVREAPIYNRLMWNFSKGIDGGELAYALNYGIANAQGNLSGTMSELDAKRLYPQGHGDAWGHYLSALTLYYKLLHTTNYVWIADCTAMDLGGVTVNVEYYDEEKFAETAAARVRTGQDIVRRTFQQTYQSAPSGLWAGYRDSVTNRCWGVGAWGVRAGQGAYFDWLTVNSLLPTQDTNAGHTGIQVIDRSTVRALGTLSAAGQSLQNTVDGADGDLNPLGLAKNIMPFDISPAGIDAGQSHFEQIYDRAIVALNNAQTTLDQAQGAAQRLRRQATSFNNYVTDTVVQNERNTRNRLLEIFGTPYTDDIGPGQSYPDGYDGPDLYHFMYTDLDAIGGTTTGFTNRVSISLPAIPAGFTTKAEVAGDLSVMTTNQVTFAIDNEGALGRPPAWTGIRSRPGEWQIAKQAYLQGMVELQESYGQIQTQVGNIGHSVESFNSYHTRIVGQFSYMMVQDALYLTSMTSKLLAEAGAKKAERSSEAHLLTGIMHQLGHAFVWGTVDGVIAGVANGTIVGVTTDPGLEERIAAEEAARLRMTEDKTVESSAATVAKAADLAMATAQQALNNWVWSDNNNDALQAKLLALKTSIAGLAPMIQGVQAKNLAVSQLAAKYQALGAEGTTLLGQLSADRAAGAWRVQSARYADMTLRIFRDESLRQYSDTFDLAAKYAYMAASAYDYETALLSGDPTAMAGSQFMDRIMRTRSLGAVVNGQPLAANGYGDAGLADALARMKGDWSVLKGRLGFNNPDTETSRFSLRTELFRIAPGSASDATWRNQLQFCLVDLMSIPEYNNYCKALGTPSTTNEPGLMITFSSSIVAGQNFFGQDLAGGDNAYDPTHSATKIRSVGVWFASYTNAFGSGMANAPRVYLFPVGADLMRSPSRSSGESIRSWNVFDQALPVPYNVSAADLNAPAWIPYFDSLSENFAAARRFASLRAYHDSGSFTPAELCTNARLIGRSVWNTKWMLLIPGRTLLADPVEGLTRFIYGPMNTVPASGRTLQGVTDIKLFFNTYSFSGD